MTDCNSAITRLNGVLARHDPSKIDQVLAAVVPLVRRFNFFFKFCDDEILTR